MEMEYKLVLADMEKLLSDDFYPVPESKPALESKGEWEPFEWDYVPLE